MENIYYNSDSDTTAPIVLFVYNRPWHTRQTVEALRKNEFVSISDLFIYSDGPRDESAKEKVDEVRAYIKTISGFKSVNIIERNTNWGLAANIINGVTEIINKYGKIIVLEDDLITSPYFLKFMNDALEFYKNYKKVWHIAGWNYPINTDGLEDIFLWRVMNCWGWATWADRWKYFEKNTDNLISNFSKEDIKRFNLEGAENFWNQIKANKERRIDTWAIYWYASIFKNNGLCLNPAVSHVINIGMDGSGQHCGNNTNSLEIYFDNSQYPSEYTFTSNFFESKQAVDKIKHYLKSKKKNVVVRAINKSGRITLGKNLIR